MEPVAKEEVERIYELYHEKKYHEYIKAGLGLVEKGIISEFLFSTIFKLSENENRAAEFKIGRLFFCFSLGEF